MNENSRGINIEINIQKFKAALWKKWLQNSHQAYTRAYIIISRIAFSLELSNAYLVEHLLSLHLPMKGPIHRYIPLSYVVFVIPHTNTAIHVHITYHNHIYTGGRVSGAQVYCLPISMFLMFRFHFTGLVRHSLRQRYRLCCSMLLLCHRQQTFKMQWVNKSRWLSAGWENTLTMNNNSNDNKKKTTTKTELALLECISRISKSSSHAMCLLFTFYEYE